MPEVTIGWFIGACVFFFISLFLLFVLLDAGLEDDDDR